MLQEETKAKRHGLLTNSGEKRRSEQNRYSEAKLVASLPADQLEKHLESSNSIRVIADKVRQERNGNREDKHSPKVRAKRREAQRLYRARKAKEKKLLLTRKISGDPTR
jgi:hypothetical protein